MSDIDYYPDHEIHNHLQSLQHHPMMRALLQFCFPDQDAMAISAIVDECHSTRDFHAKIIYPGVQRILRETSAGFTTSGFDQLNTQTAYLYISNHRDIALDTVLTNYALLEAGHIMTASAIGDNLVQLDFLLELARINRNFLVKRSLSPREMLLSSRQLSRFITEKLLNDNRSIWIAQREGRAKDGNDTTHPGVLKMLSLAKNKGEQALQYLQQLRIVPIAISYEYDPNDPAKLRELVAKAKGEPYQKTEGEDFQSILKGITGFKGHIHLQAGQDLTPAIKAITDTEIPENKQLQNLASLLDRHIKANYHCWPSNFIAADLLHNQTLYAQHYTPADKTTFLQRLEKVAPKGLERQIFLKMYANPVINANTDNG